MHGDGTALDASTVTEHKNVAIVQKAELQEIQGLRRTRGTCFLARLCSPKACQPSEPHS